MPLSPQLLQLLVCPEDHGPLYLVTGEDAGDTGECLYNPRTRRRYAVRDGIPVMLVDEADPVDEAAAARLAARIASGELTATGTPG
jgi:uncharacterized protein YbaR (Trm112 family)